MKYLITLLISLVCVSTFPQTHADATSLKWKGVDLTTILNNPAYDEIVEDQTQGGYRVLLYNVGTGCFMIQGGDWGIEGRLFHRDFGRVVRLYSNGRINSGVTESNISDTKNSYGVNVLGVTKGTGWEDVNKYCATTIMDAPRTHGSKNPTLRHWNFDRVDDTNIYYIHETINNKTYNLGAAYGEWHDPEGKGDGQFVFLDDDRVCWTTASVAGNTTLVHLENGDDVEIQKLYQWRIISEDEYLARLNNEEEGLNPSMSSLIPDRDFTRNSDDFYLYWHTDIKNDYTYSSDKRYTYTYGNYKKGTNLLKRNPRLIQEAWDSPVKLKVSFDDSNKSLENRKKNCKFGYINFEGVGTIYTTFKVPKSGWYLVECAGFVSREGYMFARVLSNPDIPEHSLSVLSGEHYGQVTIPIVENYTKDNYDNSLLVGKELLYNRNAHVIKVWVLVTDEDFSNGNNYIRVGFGKDTATKSSKTGNGYYDTDMMCIDDLRMTYMGVGPAFFYDTEESLDYLDSNSQRYNEVEYVSANGLYGGAVCLERKFTLNKWNTFSFPLPLTGELIRYAFGDKTELLRLNSIGNLSHNQNIIDFETVNLVTLDYVVEPGVFYLIKPENAGSVGENPKGEITEYYALGKMYFDPGNINSDGEELFFNSYLGLNDGYTHVTYIQTPGYNAFNPNTISSAYYAPKGSYAMSGGKMYELNKDTRIKGFRGWITLSHSIFGQTIMAIDGIGDVVTDINNPIINNNEKIVYDLTGRLISNPSKGLYIINNKKVLIR